MYYKELNILKGIAILLVVIGHSFPNDFNGNFIYEYIHKFIYSFHMPVFFFISGFFAFKIYDKNFKPLEFIKNKFKRLIIPYISFSIMALIIKVSIDYIQNIHIDIDNIIYGIFINPYENPMMSLWFLYTLFIIFVLSVLFRKQKIKNMIIISLIMALIPLGSVFNNLAIKSVFRNLIYFYLGLGSMINYKYIKEFLNKKYINIFKYFMILVLILINLFEFKMLASKITFIITSVLGISIFFIISYNSRNNLLGNLFEILGKLSFDIYLTSWFFQMSINIVFLEILKIQYEYVVLIMMFFGIVPILLAEPMLRKIKLYRFMMGEEIREVNYE